MDAEALAALTRLQTELDQQAELFDDPRAYRAGVSDALTAIRLRDPEPVRPAEPA